MHLRLTLTGAAVAVLAGPATAVAADPRALAPLDKCYVSATQDQRELVHLDGTNFTPEVPVDAFVDDVLQPMSPQPMTDALGSIHGTVKAPYIASGQRLFTVRLSEQGNGGASASAITKVTALSVTQSPVKASSSSKVRFRLRGFIDKTKPVYAHYTFNGRNRQTVLIGKPYGDCGLLSVRRRQFPFNRPRPGKWVIQFDQDQAYSPQPSLYTRLPIMVHQTPPRR